LSILIRSDDGCGEDDAGLCGGPVSQVPERSRFRFKNGIFDQIADYTLYIEHYPCHPMPEPDFDKLACLVEHCDTVFERFYDELLSNKVFSKHFTGDDQIRRLLETQKQNFIATLSETREQLQARYYHVGSVHFEHDIPYEVFLSGTRILRDIFNQVLNENFAGMELAMLNNSLFGFIYEAMAKGYLDVFIHSEKEDIKKILALTRSTTFGNEKRLLVNHYTWVLTMLTAVQNKDYSALEGLVNEQGKNSHNLYNYIEEHLGEIEPTIGLDEIERIRFRIVANTENIFFYLKREAYSEALSLIIHILEIYKLTLVLDNVISNILVRKAEDVITTNKKLSEIDPLTNVMNRRKFEELLENLLLRSHRTSLPLTLMIIDIDDFKAVNDGYGHQTGDLVLVELAHVIVGIIRKNDHLIRYGGEEFVIISADSELGGMRKLADKICREVGAHHFDKVGTITISIGMTELSGEDTPVSLFRRADELLYKAKAQGKNQVCS